MVAARQGRWDSISPLIQAGANMHAHSALALCMAAACPSENDGYAVAQMLDNRGIDWKTAMETARGLGNEEIISRLDRWWPQIVRARAPSDSLYKQTMWPA